MLTKKDLEQSLQLMEKRMDSKMDAKMDEKFENFVIMIKDAFGGMQVHLDDKFKKIDERFDSIENRLDSHDQKFYEMDCRFDAVEEKLKKLDVLEEKTNNIEFKMDAMARLYQGHEKRIIDIETEIWSG